MNDHRTWYRLETDTVLEQLGSNGVSGLSAAEAAQRLATHGPNELIDRGTKSPWRIIWEQLTALMVLVLIGAAFVSALIGDVKDVVVILSVVVLNAALGFFQEYRAEKAMAALKQMAVPSVRVRRDDHLLSIPARELVPGDLVLLEAGNVVPADGRLVEAAALRVQEAALTGESEPVDKHTLALRVGEEEPALGDRANSVFMGTVVSYGRGRYVVTDTGMNTQLGNIAAMLTKVKREATPLQQRLDQVGKGLVAGIFLVVGAVFVLGLLRGEGLRLMVLTAISTAVAAIPEGLPAVVTIALALGAQRMLKRRALIRRLLAVETLGSVTVICSDKTGTLTENRMTVTVLHAGGYRLEINNDPDGKVVLPTTASTPAKTSAVQPLLNVADSQDNKATTTAVPGTYQQGNAPLSVHDHPALTLLLAGSALCSDATPAAPGHDGALTSTGDPTETALVVAAARFGIDKAVLEEHFPRIDELPFDSERKRMTTVHRADTSLDLLPATLLLPDSTGTIPIAVSFTKGAVDSLLEVSTAVWADGTLQPLDEKQRQQVLDTNAALAAEGMRVLGLAYRPVSVVAPGEAYEAGLIFAGMAGIIDPPRPEVRLAVQTCREAGIRPVMITGDHPLTARAIARDLGIDSDKVLTGHDLERMSPDDVMRVVTEVSVYARVSPEHKLLIVEALQQRGHVVSMTGDGVNDAPALRKADIGVAMGITGTDVSKEAADMVLLNDNFATIVAAVEEGRVVYDNIRRFIRFSLAGNLGKVAVMFVALLAGMPLPLLPLQILWMNLVTDGLPGLAMGVEKAERDTMRRPPFHPNERFFGRGLGWYILWVGLLIGGLALGAGAIYHEAGAENWQTVILTTIIFSQMAQAMAGRSTRESLFSIGLFSNRPLAGAVTLTIVLHLAVVYVPFLQDVFGTHALSLVDLGVCVGLALVVLTAVELHKLWLRRGIHPTIHLAASTST